MTNISGGCYGPGARNAILPGEPGMIDLGPGRRSRSDKRAFDPFTIHPEREGAVFELAPFAGAMSTAGLTQRGLSPGTERP